MKDISTLPNIGKTLAKNLKGIGINTEDELVEAGSRKVIIQLSEAGVDTCINKLYAIEGAIQGIRWHSLPQDKKQELKGFYLETISR